MRRPTGASGLGLAELQSRFWRLISAPEPVERALPEVAASDPSCAPLSGWIRARDEAMAVERLDVYGSMYFFRLLAVLREDYPVLEKLVGPDRFHNLATDYLLAYPSENPSVRYVGARLAELLDRHPLAADVPGIADLARLEWTRGLAFDRADSPALAGEELAAVPPEGWGALRFRLVASFHLLRLGHSVHPLWLALERGEAPPVPSAEAVDLLVWRRSFTVVHRPARPSEARLLEAIAGGAPLAEVCELLAEHEGDRAARAAFELIRTWIDQGILAGIA